MVGRFGEATLAARKYKDELGGINKETYNMSAIVLKHLDVKQKEKE